MKHLSKIKPHLPIWKQEGAKVIYEQQGYEADRMQNAYHIWWVVWVDKKGNQHKTVRRVKWDGKSKLKFENGLWSNA